MKRTQVLVGSVVLSLFALALACQPDNAPTEEGLKAAQAPVPETPPTPASKVKAKRRFLVVEGAVTVDGAAATAGSEIGQTSTIETPADGSAIITLDPGSVVKLRPGTKVTLGSSERKSISVKLLLGSVWSFLTADSSYEVVGPNAVAGVRGTTFYAEADAKGHTYVCACDGTVEMQTPDGKGFKKVVKSPKSNHKGFRFMTKGRKIKAKPAKRSNHTDDEAQAIMAHIEESK